METLILETKTKREADAIKAFAKALKISIKKSPYNAEFVAKIKVAQKERGGRVVNPDNIWENIK